MRRVVLLMVACTIFAGEGVSAKIRFYSTGGIGLAYSTAKDGDMSYSPFIAPHLLTRMPIPISRKISLETGLGYTIKGFNNRITADNGMEIIKFMGKSRLHYLSVPVVVNYSVFRNNNSRVWVGAGMNYAFFITGSESARVSTYENGELVQVSKTKTPVYGVLSGARYLKTTSGKNIESLDVMLRFQVNYVWKDKYVIGLFHDQSLYDIDTRRFSDVYSIIKLRYTGLSLGLYWR